MKKDIFIYLKGCFEKLFIDRRLSRHAYSDRQETGVNIDLAIQLN
jgi:hypothetical protein